MGRLKTLEELTPGDWLRYQKTGRHARVDDPDSDPTVEELAAAGYQKPSESEPVPMEWNRSVEDLQRDGIPGRETSALTRQLRKVDEQIEAIHRNPGGGEGAFGNPVSRLTNLAAARNELLKKIGGQDGELKRRLYAVEDQLAAISDEGSSALRTTLSAERDTLLKQLDLGTGKSSGHAGARTRRRGRGKR